MEGISSHSGVFLLFCNFFRVKFPACAACGLTLILGKHILMVEKNDRQESNDGGEPNGRQ